MGVGTRRRGASTGAARFNIGPMFFASDGRLFALVTRRKGGGNKLRSCWVLRELIQYLGLHPGFEESGASSARCMFAVRLNRAGCYLGHIGAVLRLATLQAITEPVNTALVDLERMVPNSISTMQPLLGHVLLAMSMSIRMSMKRRLRRCWSEHYDGTQ